MALVWQSVQSSNVALAEETRAAGYAVLAGQSDPVWVSPTPITEGDLIPTGPLHLQSGIARLELFSGVSVVLEGDAQFEILSDMEMKVSRGKVRARVPEAATGFRIHMPDGDVVDLGTEFALDVSDTESEVHVLDGEIEWHPGNAVMQLRTQDQAMRKVATGPNEKITADSSRFIGIEELHQRADAGRFQRRQQWLDFSPTGSRVRLQVPDELGSLTFVTWVKINSLERLDNSLFLTDGHDLGEPHWQILNDRRLFFSVKKRDNGKGPDKHIFHSPTIWTPAMSGQWMMIATVYDLDANSVAHYINGDAVSTEIIPEKDRVETLRFGAVSLGNWSEPAYRKDPEFAVRNLNGSMDEFILFKAALPAAEIAKIHEAGRP